MSLLLATANASMFASRAKMPTVPKHLTPSLSELNLAPIPDDVVKSTENLVDWIHQGRPPTPVVEVDDDRVAKEKAIAAGRMRRSRELIGSTSLPALPKLTVRMPTRPTTADLLERQQQKMAAANPAPAPRKPRIRGIASRGRASDAAAASSASRRGASAGGGRVGYTPPAPPGLRRERSQMLAKLAVAETVGLDTSNTWRYAGKLNTAGSVANVSRRALARHRQLREALKQQLAAERVPTPQFAARRDLPPTNELPEPPPIQDEAAALSAPLKYWAPSSASAKCPSYMFHEPGPEVRESLAILEEMRWPGGRKRLETRHAEEVVKASMRHQVEEEKRLADGAATKVQEAYRNKMGATRRGEDQEAPSEQGEAVGEADPEASQGEER